MPTLVLDNGGYNIKVGFAGTSPTLVHNSLTRSRDRRVYVGNSFREIKDYAGLQFRRPIDRGHLVSWEAEKVIWDSIFDDDCTLGQPVTPADTTLILTEMPYTLADLTVNTDQIIFEEYEFSGYRRASPQSLVVWNDLRRLFEGDTMNATDRSRPYDCSLIVDSGYNATTVVPVLRGETQYRAVRRVDVGGKMLTNLLKETISFRYYNMMDESFIINTVKEQICFVSKDYKRDLEKWRRNKHIFDVGYVLPDHQTDKLGHTLADLSEARYLKKQGEQQVLLLGNERFNVPEALYAPVEVELEQAGLPEAVAQSINAAPEETRALLWANIVLIGGTSRLPNFRERFESEVRKLAPQNVPVRVQLPENPELYAWQGGSNLGQLQDIKNWIVTKAEYDEIGESACLRKFGKNPGTE